jgi:hypothetical protein
MVQKMEPYADRLPLMSHMVAPRESYKFANAQGRGVGELSGSEWDASAANEMKDLYLGTF